MHSPDKSSQYQEKLKLHATVIECKNYQSFNEKQKKAAIDQAKTGLSFIDQALDNERGHSDNLMWRSDLASLLPREFDPDSLSMQRHGDEAPSLEAVRRRIREGEFEYSSCAYVVRTFAGNGLAQPPELVDGVNFREVSLLDVTRLLQKQLGPS